MNKNMSYALCLCTLFVTGIIGIIIKRPMNAAMNVSGEMVIECSSDTSDPIVWTYTTDCNTGSDGAYAVTDNSNCNVISSHASHYRTEKPGGFVCNLIVFDALFSHGGCYVCSDGTGAGRVVSAFLIVVDSNANITTNMTDLISGDIIILSGEDAMISSSVTYGGPSLQPPALAPSFNWTLQSDPNQNIPSYPGSPTTSIASSYIVSKAQRPDVPSFVCNLLFNPPGTVPGGCANNTPTYRTSFVTPIYTVSYPPENISISGYPIACPYETNDYVTMTCSASGQPSPSYQWFRVGSNDVLSRSNTFEINQDGTYQCDASNIIRGVTNYASTVANVSDCFPDIIPDPKSGTPWFAIAIGIFFGLNFLISTMFIIGYGCSESCRDALNDRFPWLMKMLPCMNVEGCKCSVWIFYFVLLSIFAAFVFFPTILIMANCCKKKTKTSQVNNRNIPLSERNGRGVGGGAQVIISGQPTNPYPPRMSVTPNPPSSLDTSILSLPEHPMHRPYPHSSDQQRQPTQWGNSADPYHQVPRNLQLPRHTPSPALSSGAIIYADLGVDNQPKSRRPIQPIQNEGNPYADIAIA